MVGGAADALHVRCRGIISRDESAQVYLRAFLLHARCPRITASASFHLCHRSTYQKLLGSR